METKTHYADDFATALAIDNKDNVYITGASTGIGSNFDYATIKYSRKGKLEWTQRFNGSANGVDRPNAIAIDSAANVYITGLSEGSGTIDIATVKYAQISNIIFHLSTVRAQLLMLPLDAQRIAYSKLSPAFKNAVWKNKMQQVVGLQWTTEQQQWLNEVSDLIKPALFENNSQVSVNFMNNIQHALDSSGRVLFDSFTFIQLVERIENVRPGLPPSEPSGLSAYCNSSGGGDFCLPGYTCQDCTYLHCDQTSTGCGWWWKYACDGTCIR